MCLMCPVDILTQGKEKKLLNKSENKRVECLGRRMSFSFIQVLKDVKWALNS